MGHRPVTESFNQSNHLPLSALELDLHGPGKVMHARDNWHGGRDCHDWSSGFFMK